MFVSDRCQSRVRRSNNKMCIKFQNLRPNIMFSSRGLVIVKNECKYIDL